METVAPAGCPGPSGGPRHRCRSATPGRAEQRTGRWLYNPYDRRRAAAL